MVRLTRAQVREIDRLSTEQYHIPGIVLMENAARSAADVAIDMMGRTKFAVLVVCGTGNNGGDGLAIARHLHNRGARVKVICDWTGSWKGDAATNLQIIQAMPVEKDVLEASASSIGGQDLLIDAMFGTGLTRPIAAPYAGIIDQVNNQADRPVLAIDVPSGLDCDTGEPLGPCIRAKRTVTFVAEKAGFANPASRQYTGKITVGDIGCPRELVDKIISDGRRTNR